MPYKSSKIKIEKTQHDRRIKLTDDNKIQIKELHSDGMAIRAIARQFNVDKRAIQFILFPDRLEQNKKLRAERGGSTIYYNRNSHTKAIASLRNYKQQLFLNGEIKL